MEELRKSKQTNKTNQINERLKIVDNSNFIKYVIIITNLGSKFIIRFCT